MRTVGKDWTIDDNGDGDIDDDGQGELQTNFESFTADLLSGPTFTGSPISSDYVRIPIPSAATGMKYQEGFIEIIDAN